MRKDGCTLWCVWLAMMFVYGFAFLLLAIAQREYGGRAKIYSTTAVMMHSRISGLLHRANKDNILEVQMSQTITSTVQKYHHQPYDAAKN